MRSGVGLTISLIFLFMLCQAQQCFQLNVIRDIAFLSAGLTGKKALTTAPSKIQAPTNELECIYLYAAFKEGICKPSAADSIPGCAYCL